MIDIESRVISKVSPPVLAEYPDAFISSDLYAVPSKFPAVFICEMDNSTYTQTLELSGTEKHARVMYQVDVQSNDQRGKKKECKAITAIIDNEMQKMGFTRVECSPVFQSRDAKTYHMVSRYRAVVSENGAILRIS